MSELCKVGTIQSIDSDKIVVLLEMTSSCGDCEGKGSCSSLSSTQKIVEIPKKRLQSAKVGDQIKIYLKERKALVAICYSYLLPFVLMILAIGMAKFLEFSDLVAALISVLGLAFYYLALYLTRELWKKSFYYDRIEIV